MLITKEALKTLINGLVAKMQNYRGNWNQSDPNANDYIKNKPFYTETKFAEILPETEWVGNEVSLPNILNLETGKTYTVNYNGMDYECVANDGAEFDFPGWYLGNIASFTGGADTGEPFIMLVSPPEWLEGLVFIPLDNSASGTLSISGDIKILKTIDEEYLGLNVKNGSGNGSVIEGFYTTASGFASHAEGQGTTASSYESHAEGYETTASGDESHAEGNYTTASGFASHAEGNHTTASAYASHAEGDGTTASGDCQHVQGKYNIEDTTLAHIVGNGEYNRRSNAHTLDWNGNAWFKGDVYVGSTSGTNKDAGSVKLATQAYVDSKVSNSNSILSVSKGGTGTTTFTVGQALIGNGTGALTTRGITDITSISGSLAVVNNNLITRNTLVNLLNRTTSCGAATTDYSTYMARGEAMFSTETTPTYNGQIAWTYE